MRYVLQSPSHCMLMFTHCKDHKLNNIKLTTKTHTLCHTHTHTTCHTLVPVPSDLKPWLRTEGVRIHKTHIHTRCVTHTHCHTQVPVPSDLRPWLCTEGVRMLQQYVGVVRAALDRVMGMQVCMRVLLYVCVVCVFRAHRLRCQWKAPLTSKSHTHIT